jgi:ribonucleoside-diphosphate reductase alpha chain
VPRWLWRHVPDETALAALPERDRRRPESGLRQVVDRIAGAWTYHGWKGGYFDSEQDALAFFDEMRWLLWQRRLSPSIAQWRSAGLFWAYGLGAESDESFITDYRSGTVRRAGEADSAPCGAFINSVRDSMAGEGGVWDLWRREAAILQGGAVCGANVSELSGPATGDAGGGLAALLSVGDAAARTARGDEGQSASTRRITVDAGHPGRRDAVRRTGEAGCTAAAFETGQALVRRHIDALIRACRESRARRPTDPRGNPALRLAIQSARQAMLPESLIDRVLSLVGQGELSDGYGFTDPGAAPDGGTVTVIRADDATLQRAPDVIDDAALSAWMSDAAGLQFDSAVQGSHTCSEIGPIRTASGDGGFLFLDDTACDHAVLNAAAWLLEDGSFDTDGFRHAAQLLAMALDISLMTAAQPTPRLARRVWDFRPIGLSLAGVGELLTAMGLRYDSDEGRATCSALAALMTGSAWLTSARLAAEMGPFPGWADNAGAMQRVIRSQADAVAATLDGANPDLAEAARDAWAAARNEGTVGGYRNAQVSYIADAAEECALLGCASRGVAPVESLVRFERLPAGGWQKTAEPAVAHGLRALGYGDAEIDAMLRHLLGHATLAKAPGVNHETLRKRGFTDGAIVSVEAVLPAAPEIGLAFSPWTLGETYCRRMLGFTASELAEDGFDMLAALGFSDAGVEAANLYCCGAGTLEGAPHLAPDHLPVFDCAAPQGQRGRRRVSSESVVRMMAAAQPMVSGAVGQTVTMPHAATVADCRATVLLGWRLGLKSLTIRRAGAESAAAAARQERTDAPRQAVPALSVVETGRAPATNIRTAVAESGDHAPRDAETSRRAVSHAARSTASVPSSADVVVEQRQV